MEKEGKYIYCIINSQRERNFGPIGLGERGDEVLTIGYEDLSMVVSNCPASGLNVSRSNLLAHQKVIERVMQEFDSVLPVRFGTIAATADEIRNLLDRRYREFKTALRNMEFKIELGVKAIWKDMGLIFKEIVEGNKNIKAGRDRLINDKGKRNVHPVRKGFSNGVQANMDLGKQVFEALERKKEREAERIVDALKIASVDYKLNKPLGDEMFLNAAFLVNRGREKEFDNIMEELLQKYKGGVKFLYAGPLPVFNFVNIVIYPEEWEK